LYADTNIPEKHTVHLQHKRRDVYACTHQIYISINELKLVCQPRTHMIGHENGDVLAEAVGIVSRPKKSL
jgi:hypothetical protein